MDYLLPSDMPPAGLKPNNVPMFISFGFDDNGFSGILEDERPYAINYVSSLFYSRKNPFGSGKKETFDGENCSATFYFTSNYITKKKSAEPIGLVKKEWHDAVVNKGHEAGCHTHTHPSGRKFSVDEWISEIDTCKKYLTKRLPNDNSDNSWGNEDFGPGFKREQIYGFRTPFLDYNDNTFKAVAEENFLYDCSIEEGWQNNQDGRNFFWPYTLDEGSPCNNEIADDEVSPVGKYPGLWEMPLHVVIVPPDELCEKYGVIKGFRNRLAKLRDYFNPEDGKITGLDWNIVVDFEMTKAEYLAVLKYTFDLRMEGNRAPMLFGAHSDLYSEKYEFPPNISGKERKEVLSQFLNYVLSFDAVRVVSLKKVLDWMRNPISID